MTEPSERTMLRKEGDKTKMNIDKIKVDPFVNDNNCPTSSSSSTLQVY